MKNNIKQNKLVDSIKEYFKGVRLEWGKVTWPERHQVISETFFVIIIVLMFTGFILTVDFIFDEIFNLIQR